MKCIGLGKRMMRHVSAGAMVMVMIGLGYMAAPVLGWVGAPAHCAGPCPNQTGTECNIQGPNATCLGNNLCPNCA